MQEVPSARTELTLVTCDGACVVVGAYGGLLGNRIVVNCKYELLGTLL